MKKIVIGISGSIAVYKTCDIISQLLKKGYDIEVVMTESATKFVTPLTFGSLIKKPVLIDDFDETGYLIKHIRIVEDADCFVVVPATANVIAKIAHGICDDALTSSFLAATCPKIVCPAMNVHMYENAATMENMAILKERGIEIVDSTVGHLACGYQAKGHIAATEDIIDAIEYATCPKNLAGCHVLVSAGPTQEALDPVRFITNHSSGKMGYAIARAAKSQGAKVTLVSGVTQERVPYGVDLVSIKSAQDMYDAIHEHFESSDFVIMSAAVGDYRPKEYKDNKIKKHDDEFVLELTKNKDILASLGKIKTHQMICGFAMETENVLENAKNKFFKKNCDMLVVNDLFEKGAGFRTSTNKVAFITHDAIDHLELMSKEELGIRIINKLKELKGE